MASLNSKVATLRTQLGIDEGLPLVKVVEQACRELGLENKGTNLVEKADACLAALGHAANSSPVVVQAVMMPEHEMMPMAVPVVPIAEPVVPMAEPVDPRPKVMPLKVKPIKPVRAEAPRAMVAARAPRGRRPDGTFDARTLAGCWGCVCIPGGCALEAKQADGPDALVHRGIAIVNPVALLGVGYEDRWHRVHGNVFQKEGADDKLDYSCSSCFVCLGLGITCKVSPACYPLEHRKIPAEELAGTWCCACVPCGWSCVKKEAQGPDRLRHHGVLFWWFAIPIPYDDVFVREGNKNCFHKHDDPNMRAVYHSPSCNCASLLGGECKVC